MRRTAAGTLACAFAAAALALALLAAAGQASTTKTCKPPKYPGVGYFTSLEVRAVTCTVGRRLVMRYYRCRIVEGGKTGTCTKHVLGFACKENRIAIPTELDARVTCTKGAHRVVHTYQQDT